MEAQATSAMHVIKKEDKFSVLKAFIAQDLDARRSASEADRNQTSYCVIARSEDSPVARALAAHAEEAMALGISIFVVFACSIKRNAGVMRGSETDGANALTTRVLQDGRLLDAHEALLMGSETAWVGDCMRRDPSTSDAYERFSTHCTFTCDSVGSAFHQLWDGARPIRTSWIDCASHTETAASTVSDEEVIASSAITAANMTSHATSTRH